MSALCRLEVAWSILIFFARRLPPSAPPWVLLGEGSFHQIHGGVATNVPMEQHPGLAFSKEYEQIRGEPYAAPQYDPNTSVLFPGDPPLDCPIGARGRRPMKLVMTCWCGMSPTSWPST